MLKQKKLAHAGRAGTKHSCMASPAVVLLCGRERRRELCRRRLGPWWECSVGHLCFSLQEPWAGLALEGGTMVQGL